LFQTLKGMNRSNAIVHRYSRALLERGESPDDYWSSTVRKKKRKEIGRLENRLAELGEVKAERSCSSDDASEWIAQFLTLEASGWKASEGAALAKEESTSAFFREALVHGLAQGRVELLRLTVGDRVIAMLVNFVAGAGSFSFKIAYDEEFARYSPGILIEKANLQRLANPTFGWMDSCAVEDHPMINSLWKGRREVIRVAFPRKGVRPTLVFTAVRLAERGWSAIKNFRKSEPVDVRSHDNDA
jgi:CelD/BcsL family acetyltransferase involved in cellulose biosynthesis